MSIYTLALESSCDETSASVLKDGRTVLSNVISSQVPIHRKFGGVVPEIASRHHIEQVIPVIDQALRDANVTLQDIDHIGVTYGPGLVGALDRHVKENISERRDFTSEYARAVYTATL